MGISYQIWGGHKEMTIFTIIIGFSNILWYYINKYYNKDNDYSYLITGYFMFLLIMIKHYGGR